MVENNELGNLWQSAGQSLTIELSKIDLPIVKDCPILVLVLMTSSPPPVVHTPPQTLRPGGKGCGTRWDQPFGPILKIIWTCYWFSEFQVTWTKFGGRLWSFWLKNIQVPQLWQIMGNTFYVVHVFSIPFYRLINIMITYLERIDPENFQKQEKFTYMTYMS